MVAGKAIVKIILLMPFVCSAVEIFFFKRIPIAIKMRNEMDFSKALSICCYAKISPIALVNAFISSIVPILTLHQFLSQNLNDLTATFFAYIFFKNS